MGRWNGSNLCHRQDNALNASVSRAHGTSGPALGEPAVLMILLRVNYQSIECAADCHFPVTFLSLWKRPRFFFHYSRSS
jgi:hypothetical protein